MLAEMLGMRSERLWTYSTSNEDNPKTNASELLVILEDMERSVVI